MTTTHIIALSHHLTNLRALGTVGRILARTAFVDAVENIAVGDMPLQSAVRQRLHPSIVRGFSNFPYLQQDNTNLLPLPYSMGNDFINISDSHTILSLASTRYHQRAISQQQIQHLDISQVLSMLVDHATLVLSAVEIGVLLPPTTVNITWSADSDLVGFGTNIGGKKPSKRQVKEERLENLLRAFPLLEFNDPEQIKTGVFGLWLRKTLETLGLCSETERWTILQSHLRVRGGRFFTLTISLEKLGELQVLNDLQSGGDLGRRMELIAQVQLPTCGSC
ncbi:hypothetical protein B0H19DRAFT_1377750 [Mycena capillaripes]|nr:hypothetical protein B0H19DRAFT_1377750 [Mycena capillaripes]